METIVFNNNWNGKLFNQYFTTFRYYKRGKFEIGKEFQIELFKGKTRVLKFRGKIILNIVVKLHEVSELFAYIDTGYSKQDFIKLVQTMYKKFNPDYSRTNFCILLIQNLDYGNLETISEFYNELSERQKSGPDQ